MLVLPPPMEAHKLCKPQLALFPCSGKLCKDHRAWYKLLDNLQHSLCDLAAIVLANFHMSVCRWSHLSLQPLRFVTYTFFCSFSATLCFEVLGPSLFLLFIYICIFIHFLRVIRIAQLDWQSASPLLLSIEVLPYLEF